MQFFLPELLSKNTGHHAAKYGSDFSFTEPASICLMGTVGVGLVPRLQFGAVNPVRRCLSDDALSAPWNPPPVLTDTDTKTLIEALSWWRQACKYYCSKNNCRYKWCQSIPQHVQWGVKFLILLKRNSSVLYYIHTHSQAACSPYLFKPENPFYPSRILKCSEKAPEM